MISKIPTGTSSQGMNPQMSSGVPSPAVAPATIVAQNVTVHEEKQTIGI